MKQTGHTWIALRAITLIQEDPKTRNLANILAPWAKHSYFGCWLPDMPNFKKGHGIVGNHTFKNAPYTGKNKSRFVVPKQKLLDGLDPNLALHDFLGSVSTLKTSWWNQPYKAVQKDGEQITYTLEVSDDTREQVEAAETEPFAAIVIGKVSTEEGQPRLLLERVLPRRKE